MKTVNLIQSHRVAEERIPADREVHPSTEGVLSRGVEAPVERVERPVELPGEARSMKSQCSPAEPR